MYNYVVSGVVNSRLESLKLEAMSDKQAWFLFSKRYGYNHRDFKVIKKESNKKSTECLEQICMF